jgi:DNA polymerase
MKIQAPPPPRLAPLPPAELLRWGQKIPVAWGYSTVLPSWDVETYSEAGFIWDDRAQKFKHPIGATKKGLPAVGSSVYFEHPTADIICLAYDLKDGRGCRRWKPGDPNPQDLIEYLLTYDDSTPSSYSQPGIITAHNSGFELRCAIHVLHKKYGWPLLHVRQMRCSMAKARAFCLPGALAGLSEVLRLPIKKDKDGERLIKKFSMPRDPTKKDPRTRITVEDDQEDAEKYYSYNETDIIAEAGASARIPDLIPQELEYWLADQDVNWRGVGVDVESVHACIAVLQQAHSKYNAELYQITDGTVARASEIGKLQEWVADCTGYRMKSGDTEAVEEAIQWLYKKIDDGGNDGGDIAQYAPVLRALEIRNLIGSAAVKKVYAMARMATRDDRLCDLFIYHGARTGRDTHADVQPGNLPKSGVKIRWCTDVECGRSYALANAACPWCGASDAFSDVREKGVWDASAADDVLEIMRHGNLELVEYFYGDAVLAISGCVRSLLVAAEGHDLICSDYSAIEAVVLAMLSGEQWRIDAFMRGDSIYYHGAAGVTGKTYQFYVDYKSENGVEHPDRSKIGKVAELALGYLGWVGAWRKFDSTDNFTDDEVKELINKWRSASPMLVECGGGQTRGKPWRPDRFENYGYEGMFLNAILYPGQVFEYRGIKFNVQDDILFITLLSGRKLTYHSPRAERQERFQGVETYALSYMTWNSNPAFGAIGWVRMDTYAGKILENITSATARDIMAHAVVNLEKANYPVVLRVHDEIASEVRKGFGSEQEFESIMADLPWWAKGWPVRCGGTWRGRRYRK